MKFHKTKDKSVCFLLQRANIFLSRQETETRLKNSSGAVGGVEGPSTPFDHAKQNTS